MLILCLSIPEPWATLTASGKRPIEIRQRPTRHRGAILIYTPATGQACKRQPGLALAVANLVECRPMESEDAEAAMFVYSPAVWCWRFENILRLAEPFEMASPGGTFNEILIPDDLAFIGRGVITGKKGAEICLAKP